jgi:hypothetical protein
MLGLDTEMFTKEAGTDTIIPALAAFQRSGLPMKSVFKKIGCDIAPKGYDSLELALPHSMLTEDGAAIETPCTPSDDVDELVANVKEGVVASWKVAEAIGAEMVAAPLVYLRPEDVASSPELRVLGCSPDIDIYGMLEGRPSQDPRRTFWRTGGGHIHFSIGDRPTSPDLAQELVVLCDIVLGTADVLLEHSPLGRKRREMYGQPGKHRIQKWGIEYRTMSNTWMVRPDVATSVLGLAKAIHTVVGLGERSVFEAMATINFDQLIGAITNCDPKLALLIFDTGIRWLQDVGADVTGADLVRKIYQNGGIVGSYGYTMEGWK